MRPQAFIALVAALSLGCGGGSDHPTQPEAKLFHGWAVSANDTGDPDVLVAAVHQSGLKLAVLGTATTGGLGFNEVGAVSLQSDMGDAVVWLDAAGLPSRARMDGFTVLYANWTTSTVDIATIASDGTIRLVRGIQLPPSVVAGMAALRAARQASADAGPSGAGTLRWPTSQIIKWGGVALSAAGCGLSIGGALASGGLAVPVALMACTGTGIKVWAAVTNNDDPAIGGSALAISGVAGVAGCVLNTLNCFSFVATLAQGATLIAANAILSQDNEVSVAEGALAGGAGDVQVTLTWDAAVDLDLWVTDPSGERIYFGNRTSASGGMLDRDAMDGFGPENIFWNAGAAPAGSYTVEVDYYSSFGSANYDVLIQAFGEAKTYHGSLLPGQTALVAQFTSGQPLPGAPGVLRSATRESSLGKPPR